MNGKNIMVIAGETSGDMLGALLVEELKKIDPGLMICGIGGDRMQNSGVEIVYHINKMSFLGFSEVLKHLPFIKRVQKDLLDIIKERNIRNIILIDYPGFNLNFAKRIKPLKINVLYYISPQVWAWGAGRIKKIKNLVRKIFVLFDFEEKIYSDSGIPVEFVGHPLVDKIAEYQFMSRGELCKKLSLDENKDILLLMPGSRTHEIEKILPPVIRAAEKLCGEFNLQIVIARAAYIGEELIGKFIPGAGYTIADDYIYDLMKHSRLGIIKSGTSTLEAGILSLPMVIVYKASRVTYLIGKKLVKLSNIGMANIITGRQLVPELIQDDVSEEKVYDECRKLLSDEALYNSTKAGLDKIAARLGDRGASRRAAESIFAILNEAAA